MQKQKVFTVRGMAEIGIFTAIAFVLDYLQGPIWHGVFTSGGSIGFAMVPILFLAYRRGFLSAFISGLLLALIQMVDGIYTLPNAAWYLVVIQVALDYILAYPLVAFAGLFKPLFDKANTKGDKILWIVIGSVIGGLLKFMCHFLSGFIFWGNADFAGGPVLYSLMYNSTYMLPNIIICTGVMVLLVTIQPKLFIPKEYQVAE